jgi:hypothetical protein
LSRAKAVPRFRQIDLPVHKLILPLRHRLRDRRCSLKPHVTRVQAQGDPELSQGHHGAVGPFCPLGCASTV